jgi:hypothetical protein
VTPCHPAIYHLSRNYVSKFHLSHRRDWEFGVVCLIEKIPKRVIPVFLSFRWKRFWTAMLELLGSRAPAVVASMLPAEIAFPDNVPTVTVHNSPEGEQGG